MTPGRIGAIRVTINTMSEIDKIRDGDSDALARFLERRYESMRRLVERRAGRVLAKESSTDIVQSVMRELIRKVPEAEMREGEAGLEAWLVRSTLRKLIDRHRYYTQEKRNQEREVASLDDATRDISPAALSKLMQQITPSRMASERETIQRVMAALDSLTPEHREVISLAYLEQLPHSEIAILMERSEEATRSLLARALAKLAMRVVGPTG